MIPIYLIKSQLRTKLSKLEIFNFDVSLDKEVPVSFSGETMSDEKITPPAFTVYQLRKAKAAAVKMFTGKEGRYDKGFTGFGIGNQVVRVYVLNDEASKRVPATIEGVPVEIVLIGEIRAL